MDRIVPLVQFTFDPNKKESGMVGISLVDKPAIESNFQYFEEQKPKPQYFKVEGYEGIVQGLALIPDKPILRYDKNDNPYFGYFTAETIKQLKNKFSKDLMTNNVSADHNGKIVDGYLTESFIIDSPERLADVKARGIADATMGSWFVQYQIDDPATFQRVVDGELRGFSIEAFLQSFLQVNKPTDNVNNQINTIMNKLIEKFQAMLDEIKLAEAAPAPVAAPSGETKPVDAAKPEVKKMESAKVYGGTDMVEYGNIGEPVTVTAVDGTKSPAKEGDYILDNQKEITVDAAGNLAGIESTSDQSPVVAPSPADLAKPVGVAQAQFDAVVKELAELKAAKEAEITALKAEITKLSKAPIVEPIINPTANPKAKPSKEELAKLSNLERIALSKGIEISSRTLNKFRDQKKG
jgi:hypothetical protein